MADTATDAAPVSPQTGETTAAPPAVEQAARGQRSTGGDPGAPQAEARAINLSDVQARFRQAYGRQKEMATATDQDAAHAEATQGEAPQIEPGRNGTAPMGPEGPVVQLRQRDPATGRFLPREEVTASATATAPAPAAPAAVDEPPTEGVQKAPTPTPPRPASPRPPAADAKAKPDAPTEPGAAPEASPSSATPEQATQAPAPQAPAEEFASERWQRAFRAQPGLRREVARLRADPSLTPAALAEKLSEKLSEGVQAADAEDWRVEQMRQLRRDNPQAYAQQMELEEQEARAAHDLSVRISSMIATAFDVDADDPDYLKAGPEPGEDEAAGLAKFVEYMATKSPKLTGRVDGALQAERAKHAEAIAALKAQHKLDLQAAEERGRARGRSPWGSGQAPAPRANGNGVVPIGEQTGTTVPARAPDVATVRGLIGLGYQQREGVQ